jgi:hypothetical protein
MVNKCRICKSSKGKQKILYDSKENALNKAALIKQQKGVELVVYPCPISKGWHLSSELEHDEFENIGNINRRYNENIFRVLFFDLEFYVPKEDRNIQGIRANPYKNGHFILGGTFASYYPFIEQGKIEINKHWIWDYENNEEKLLKAILNNIVTFSDEKKAKEIIKNTVICGDKISRLDIPYLFGRCLKNNIDTDSNLFYFLNRFDIIELNNIIIPFLKNNGKPLFPVPKEMISHLFLNKICCNEMKTLVWDYYDNKNYQTIMEHNEEETIDNLNIYKTLIKIDNSKYIRKKYLKDTFEERLKYINNVYDKNIILENFHLNRSEEYYLLNDITFDEPKNIFFNIKLKEEIKRIMEEAYFLTNKNKPNGT